MANSKRNYHDEDTHRFNDCVEGDTVSEGDTSDEEDIEACKNKTSTRRTSSKRKEGLELPSGSADGSRCFRGKRRKLLCCVAFTIAAAAIGGGVYAALKFTGSLSPSTVMEEDYASSSSISVEIPSTEDGENDSFQNVDTIPTTEEEENNSVQNSEDVDTIPTTEEEENNSVQNSEDVDTIPTTEEENNSVQNSEVVDTIPTTEEEENNSVQNSEVVDTIPTTEEEENNSVQNSEVVDTTTEDENESPEDKNESSSDSFGIHQGDSIAVLDEFMDHQSKTEENQTEEEAQPMEWPSLMGKTGEEAKEQLELLYGEDTYDIYVLNENSPTTRDYRHDRIRIFTNDEGVVTQIPRIG